MDSLLVLESRAGYILNSLRRHASSLARTTRQVGQPCGGAMTPSNMRALRVLALIVALSHHHPCHKRREILGPRLRRLKYGERN
jgi:hypothetical protein